MQRAEVIIKGSRSRKRCGIKNYL